MPCHFKVCETNASTLRTSMFICGRLAGAGSLGCIASKTCKNKMQAWLCHFFIVSSCSVLSCSCHLISFIVLYVLYTYQPPATYPNPGLTKAKRKENILNFLVAFTRCQFLAYAWRQKNIIYISVIWLTYGQNISESGLVKVTSDEYSEKLHTYIHTYIQHVVLWL